MRAAIVNGEHLDVLVIAAPIDIFVLDSNVRKVNLVIEARQVMLQCPRADFFLVAIGMSVVVVAVAVAFVQPLLIVALQLVVEDDTIDPGAPVLQALGGVKVRVIDLRVVFQLAPPFEASVENLTVTLAAIAMAFQKLTAALSQDHRMVAAARNPNGLDQPLLAKISPVARSRIGTGAGVIAQTACGDDAKRADRRERSGFRASQSVFMITITDDFAVYTARQIEIAPERVARIVAVLAAPVA